MVETVVNDPPSSAVDVNVAALEPDANHKGTQDTEQAVQADQQTDAVASNNAPDNEANGHKQTEQVDPVEWASRMWFVKVPKPQEDATLLALEQEHDSLKAQMNLLSESFKIKKMEKDAIETARRGADAVWKKCKEALLAKDQELGPIKELRQRRNALAEELAGYKDLSVKSEEELDKVVSDMEARIAQETMTLNEEKALMAAVRKLRSQRERIKEYGLKSLEMTKLRAEIKALEASLDSVDEERKALKEELDTAWSIRAKYMEEERGVREVLDGIAAERQGIRELRDASWERLMSRKTPKQAKLADFYANRKFSKQVRELLANGQVVEARVRCAAQTDEVLARLNGDAEYRAEYYKLFDLQRPRKFMRDDELDHDTHQPTKGGAKKASERPPMDPEETKRRAQALIESTLAQATAQAREEAAAAAAAPPPPALLPEASLPAAGAPEGGSGITTAAAAAGGVVPVVKKPKQQKPVVLPEAALPEALLQAHDKFELPQYITAPQAADSAQGGGQGVPSAPPPVVRVSKEQAAAEAAARKERRKQQAEKRRARAEAEAAAREAAAKARDAAAAQDAALAAAAAAADAAATHAGTDDGEGVSLGPGGGPTGGPAGAEVSQLGRRGAKGSRRGGLKGPKARGPPRRSKWGLSNPYVVYSGLAVLLVLLCWVVYALFFR